MGKCFPIDDKCSLYILNVFLLRPKDFFASRKSSNVSAIETETFILIFAIFATLLILIFFVKNQAYQQNKEKTVQTFKFERFFFVMVRVARLEKATGLVAVFRKFCKPLYINGFQA